MKNSLPQQIIFGKPICEIKKSERKNIFSLNRVLMIHKYNTNQSIRFYYKKMPSTQFQNIGMVEGIQFI
jgi:hypothetical protein